MALGYCETFFSLATSIQNAIEFIVQELQPEEIILFGSRARGDHRPTSDFDIAVKKIHQSQNWARVSTMLEEEPFTLFKIDLLKYEELNLSYRKNVDKEGVLLYGTTS